MLRHLSALVLLPAMALAAVTFETDSRPVNRAAPGASYADMLARITPAGRARMDQVASDHGAAWRGLGVSILHRLVIGDLLGAKEIPTPGYVHLVREVVEGLGTGKYPLAALVMPATVEDIRKVSETGERMPAKSTYFYPKLASGLVFNPLD